MNAITVQPRVAPDHLVVAARTLADGAAWCEATLGVLPRPGGRHPRMGTHNLLVGTGSPRFPMTYIEIIAIDPDATVPGTARWFDLDSPAMQQAIATLPRLVHWVARTSDMGASLAALRAAGSDPGPAVAAERMTPRGLLRWRITLRDDGRRPGAGAVPLLIEWASKHPSEALPPSGVTIDSIELGGVAAELATMLGATSVSAAGTASPLAVALMTPRGRVELSAPSATLSPAGSGRADNLTH